MNGVLGKVVVGALTLVPGAGLFYLLESVAPRVQYGEISWMHFLLTAGLVMAASFALLVGLIVHAVRSRGIRGVEKGAWIAGLFLLLPVVGPIYWLAASIRGAAPSETAS